METNLFLSLILFSSWVVVGFSQRVAEVSGDLMPCMQKLLPCQPYLLSSSPPPTTCCIPLKGMIGNDPKCLCDVFNNPELLKNLNITQNDALKFTKACGANVDISVCKNAAMAPATSPATPTSPSNGSSSSNSTGSSTTKSSACGISHFGGSGFFILFVSLIFSAF